MKTSLSAYEGFYGTKSLMALSNNVGWCYGIGASADRVKA
jgi:hypothetical protein